jgi:SAM-dependent methyltransferase
MAQNIYDRPDFFAGYSQLRRSIDGLEGAVEWPSVRSLLPDVVGLRIVDLGCGFGWFCRWAKERGAAEVLGLDASERMLTRARSWPNAEIRYEVSDLEQLELSPNRFDLAYSSLALHYVENLASVFATVHGALVPGGCFVFSIEHPIYMAPARPGWSVDADGRRTWPVDGYFDEGPRRTDWLAPGVVKQHRTLGTTLNLLIRSGFQVEHVEEFCPSPKQIAVRPELAEERDRPTFLLVRGMR